MEMSYADDDQQIRVIDRDEREGIDAHVQLARLIGDIIRKTEFSRPGQIIALVISQLEEHADMTPFPGATAARPRRVNETWDNLVIAAQEHDAAWDVATEGFIALAGRGEGEEGGA
jgi:hypothetical protein